MFEERGAEADRKLVDLEFENFARHVMPEFVHRDHDEQDEDGDHDRADGGKYARRRK